MNIYVALQPLQTEKLILLLYIIANTLPQLRLAQKSFMKQLHKDFGLDKIHPSVHTIYRS